jgi:hypothetical protein
MINNNEGFSSLKQNIDNIIASTDYAKKFSLKTIFKTGNQGVCGLLETEDGTKAVFKCSQFIDYIAEHEFNILRGLDKLSDFCPHFCRSLGFADFDMEPKYKDGSNPFVIVSKYPIKKGVLLEEYVDGLKMNKMIKPRNLNMIFANIKQVFAAVTMAQNNQHFAHYDLHSDNILLQKCSRDDVAMYIFDDENHMLVPTHGYFPKIIDFGFAYNDSMNDNYATTGFSFTDVGYMSDRFDWIADFKVFLVSISKDIIDEVEDDERSITLRHIAKNIFGKLKLDWQTGWDKDDKKDNGPTSVVIDKLNKLVRIRAERSIFRDQGYACIDIIQSMLILPLEKKDTTEMVTAYPVFLNEFRKIEKEINSSTYMLYILKRIVDSAKDVRADYIDDTKRPGAVRKFKNDVLEAISSIAKFCNPQGVKYELMMCSLYSLANCIEGMLFKYIETRVEKKTSMYKNIIPRSNIDFVNIIDVNFEDRSYKYSDKTIINVFDSTKKVHKKIFINEDQARSLNSLPASLRSDFVHELYNGKNEYVIDESDNFYSEESSEWEDDLSESDILGTADDEE